MVIFHSFLYIYQRVTFPVAHPIFVASKYPQRRCTQSLSHLHGDTVAAELHDVHHARRSQQPWMYPKEIPGERN